MNLKEMRKLLVETSGRYDLWNDDGSDNGANFYIQMGQKFLETLSYWDKMLAVKNIFLTGANNFMLTNVRTIDHVYARTSRLSRYVELIKINLQQAREFIKLGTDDMAPLFYTPMRMRGQVDNVLADNFFMNIESYEDVLDSQNYESVGILLSPFVHSGTTVQVEIHGLFREPLLACDDTTNYWASEWPNVLLYAAMREMEIMNRNTQGMKDWENAINNVLVLTEKDSVMDEAHDVTEMLG